MRPRQSARRARPWRELADCARGEKAAADAGGAAPLQISRVIFGPDRAVLERRRGVSVRAGRSLNQGLHMSVIGNEDVLPPASVTVSVSL